MLTARGESTDRIVGLELGADDYLPKPFEPRELLARVQGAAAARRRRGAGDEVLRFGASRSTSAPASRASTARAVADHRRVRPAASCCAQSPAASSRATRSWTRCKGHPLEAFDRSIDVHISRIRAVHRGRSEGAAPRPHGARRRLLLQRGRGMNARPALPRGLRSCSRSSSRIMLIMTVALLAAVSLFFWQIVTPMLNGR